MSKVSTSTSTQVSLQPIISELQHQAQGLRDWIAILSKNPVCTMDDALRQKEKAEVLKEVMKILINHQ